MAEVTIVIPLYNKERWIERAIRSVQQQTFENWRLIIVNDGSTDKGPHIACSIEDGRIEVVNQDNTGPGAARNVGIRMAKTDYITFLDADDEFHPDFLEVTLRAIQENEVAMVSTTMLELPKKFDTVEILREKNIKPGIFFFKGDEDPEKVRAVISIIHQCTILTRVDVVKKYGCFFDKNRCVLGEDTTFLWRIAFSERFMIIGQALVSYHMEDSELGTLTIARPLSPYLKDSNVLLDYCPTRNHDLIRQVLDVLVLRRIVNQAHRGLRFQSFLLLMRHPGTQRYKEKYYDCIKRLVPGYKIWSKIRRSIHYVISKQKGNIE